MISSRGARSFNIIDYGTTDSRVEQFYYMLVWNKYGEK